MTVIEASGAQWKTIDSAPMDGTDVLLYGEGRVTIGHWMAEKWPTAAEFHASTGEYLGEFETGEVIDACWISWDGGFSDDHPCTHWMPMPGPPK